MRLVFRPLLAAAAFQPASGQCRKRSLWLSHFTGAGISVRSFARPQRRSHAISGSMFPPCTFDSPAEHLRGSVRSQAPSLRSVSRPIPGRFHRPTPVSRADFRRSRVFHPPPLPFGHFRTLRLKAFSEHPTREARLTELRSPFAPRCDFFRFRSGSTLPVRCVPLDYRSVNPGTEAIMHPDPGPRQMKNQSFSGVSTAF